MQKKNRWEMTPPDSDAQTTRLEVIRRAPGPGAIHVVDERDVIRFTALIRDWPDLSRGLRSIVLESSHDEADGWCRYDGVIAIPAWPKDLVRDVSAGYYLEHEEVFARIGVACEPLDGDAAISARADLYDDDDGGDPVRCWFDRATARAFVLMHIFLHELGHHVDKMSTPRADSMKRGEEFAEDWAFAREQLLWPLYKQHFGHPSGPQKRRT